MSVANAQVATQLFVRDVAFAWRGLQRAPMFTTVVVLTLALGIGANAAVIGVIDTLLFRKLPVPHPERVVGISQPTTRERPGQGGAALYVPSSDYVALRTRTRGLVGLASFKMAGVYADEPLAGDYVWTAFVSGNYFDVLGVHARLGRTIRPDESDVGSGQTVVVISDFLWRTKFDADPRVIGRPIDIGKVRFTIIGVMPPGFTGLQAEGRTNLWIPDVLEQRASGAGSPFLASGVVQVFGRLAPGATLDEVQASLDIAARELRAQSMSRDNPRGFRASIRDRLASPSQSLDAVLWLTTVWVMIALLHFVACSNVAGLMLGRAAMRRRELGVRLCLGASRMRILRESLIEASWLAALGGAGGLLIGRWLSQLIATMQFMSTSDSGLDLHVVGLVSVVTLGTVLQFGMLPALDASRADPLVVLRTAGHNRRRGRDRFGMVIVGQVTVSVFLLANAAAFTQLFLRQLTADPGYDVEHLLVVSAPLRSDVAKTGDWAPVYDDVAHRLSAVPGVRAVAAARGAPLFNSAWYEELIVPGHVETATDDHRPTALQAVGPGYFATLGVSMVHGREFTMSDRLPIGSPRDAFDVVVINETLARRMWPGQDPIGKRLGLRSGAHPMVIGIVRDMRDVSTVGFAPRAYFPLLERRGESFDVVVRTMGDPVAVEPSIFAALRGSATIVRPTIRTLDDVRDGQLSVSRVGSTALAICAGLALALTALGLYGVVTMSAAQRRAEIGIRMALGAPATAVHGLLLRKIGELVAIGGVLGLVCGFGTVTVERGWVGPILSLGPAPVAACALLVLAMSGVATYIPSARATRQRLADVLRSS